MNTEQVFGRLRTAHDNFRCSFEKITMTIGPRREENCLQTTLMLLSASLSGVLLSTRSRHMTVETTLIRSFLGVHPGSIFLKDQNMKITWAGACTA